MGQPMWIAAIMAGGSGERFWPLSRATRPKQLLRITSDKLTMLEEVIERVKPLIPAERIYIATSRLLEEPIRRGLPRLPAENILGEPCKRNTAGCLAWVTANILARHGETAAPDISLAVLAADAAIDDAEKFRATVRAAIETANAHHALATIGFTPTRPETGYGYIEIAPDARPLDAGSGLPPVFPVSSFREKPDRARAEQFLAEGRFFWNSGTFYWNLATFLEELERAAPDHARAAREMARALVAGDGARADGIFEALPDISIDYALMEKASRVVMARADYSWDDVGAWDALDRTYPHDDAGNVTAGDPVLIDTRDSIVYNEPGAEAMAVAVVGVEGLAVVVSRDGVLVIPKSRAQDVKKAVSELKRRGAGQL